MPTITIDAGESSGTAEISITPTDNMIYNDDIKIMVSVTEASGLASRPVEITLKNDEAKPTLALEIVDGSTLAESGDTGTATARLW